jgi:GTP-binding protein LepA
MEPKQRPVKALHAGEVGYLCASIKEIADARVGDTMTLAKQAATEPLPGYSEPNPMVYCGLFPTEGDKFQALRDALGKLELNDAALSYEPEASTAMGSGFRCGFLGLLHMEIVQERLEREFGLDLITTAPSVVYKVLPAGCTDLSDPRVINSPSPSKMPDPDKAKVIMEPICRMELITPSEYTGTLIELGQERRGIYKDMKFLTPTRTTLIFELPLAEVITDYFDVVKSRTKGYASVEYSFLEYRQANLCRLDIRINGELAPPLATVVHKDVSHKVGKALARRLKELIPRQQFKVPIQACIGQQVVASAQISPMRKDVLAKCYGGDISRKKKLLQKQAKGKKRMKAMGSVNVPQEAFMAVLSIKPEEK